MARMISHTQLLSNSWHKQLLFIVFLRGEFKSGTQRGAPFCYQFMSCLVECAAFLSEVAFSFLLDKRSIFAYNEGGFQRMQEVRKWPEILQGSPP